MAIRRNRPLLGLFGRALTYNYNGRQVYDNALNRRFFPPNDNWDPSSFGSDGFAGKLSQLFDSLINSLTGAHLTGAQQEANQFSADEAEKQRQFEKEMSNTAYQRQVNDLQDAGINPIMAASNGVSLPSSTAAASVSPGAATFQMSSLIELMRLKEMLPLEKEALKAQTQQTKALADKTEAETIQIGVGIEKLRVDIESSKLDNYSKSVINRFLDRQQQAELNMKNASVEYYNSLVRSVDKQIEKMDYEECEIFMRCCDLQEHIQYLVSQESLSYKQQEELSASITKLNSESRLIGLQIDNFDDLSVVGSESSNFRGGPFSVGESRPVTLRDMKERAEKRKNSLSEHKGKSLSDIKREYPE